MHERSRSHYEIAGDVSGKTWPSVKKPVRSTMPAMTLSSGGSRFSKRVNSATSLDASAKLRGATEFLASVGMFDHSHGLCQGRAVGDIIDDQLGNDEAQAHCQNDDHRGHAGGYCSRN